MAIIYKKAQLYQRLKGTCDGYAMVYLPGTSGRKVPQRTEEFNIRPGDCVLALGQEQSSAAYGDDWIWISFYHLRARAVVWIRREWLSEQGFYALST